MMLKRYINSIKEHFNQTKIARVQYLKESILWSFSMIGQERYGSCLDVGCGIGESAHLLSGYADETFGIDYNPRHIRAACKKYMNVRFKAESVYDLKFRRGQFDLITAFSLLEHLEDLGAAIEKISQVQKDKGIFLVQIPNRYFFFELHTYLPFLYLLPLRMRIFIFSRFGYTKDALFASGLSLATLKKELKPHYDVLAIKKMIYPIEIIPPNFRPIYKLSLRLGLFEILPFGYILVCRKKVNKD